MQLKWCRHCKKERAHRPRGLGFNCYKVDAIRSLYPPDETCTRRGLGVITGPGIEPVPTHAEPGTPEKLAVLMERASRCTRR